MCGQCCHNHSLPLTLAEAISWLEDNGNLAIFCEAMPWAPEPSPHDLRATHQRKRSFAVSCGSSSARVTAILVAVVSGACKNLGEDSRCRIYESRPLVCRIYPAEISPFIQLNTSAKACPPEAWVSDTAFLSDGSVVDLGLQSLIEKSRQTDRDDALQKGILCSDLNIDVAAITDEGFVAHEPDRKTLLDALRRARAADRRTLSADRPWRLYSRVPKTLASLKASGMETLFEKGPEESFTFLHAPQPTV
jgi:Fe-S-cluster containining protein